MGELYLGKVEVEEAAGFEVEVAAVLVVVAEVAEDPEVELYFGNDGAEAVEVEAVVDEEELYLGKFGAVWVPVLPEVVVEELVEELPLELPLELTVGPEVVDPEVVPAVDPEVAEEEELDEDVDQLELEELLEPELDEDEPKADLAPTVPVGLDVVVVVVVSVAA